MNAIEFETTMPPNGGISLPANLLDDIPAGQHVRVLVMWEPEPDDATWRNTGRHRFEAAYADQDAVYEQLMDDAQSR